MKKLIITAGFSLLALYSQVSASAVVCDLCSLSNSGSSPTALIFAAGDNIVKAKLDPSAGADSRFFSFNIADGYRLDSILLEAFSYVQIASNPTATGVAFFGLKQGVGISPSTNNPAVVDGYALLGAPVAPNPINGVIPTDVGEDVLPSLVATGVITRTQLPNALLAGTYTVWLRENRTIDEFSLNFKVSQVPLPATAWLMGSVLLGFAARGRRAGNFFRNVI
jgi:hypothetical protein